MSQINPAIRIVLGDEAYIRELEKVTIELMQEKLALEARNSQLVAENQGYRKAKAVEDLKASIKREFRSQFKRFL